MASCKILYKIICRSKTTDEELGELTKTTNPDEINIDEDYSSDEDQEVEGEIIDYGEIGSTLKGDNFVLKVFASLLI